MNIPKVVKLILLSISPVVELRGAIIYGISRSINPFLVYFLACLGSTLVIVPLYYFLMPCLSYLGKIKGIGTLFIRLQKKAISQSKKLGKYQFLGLLLFVGIPLPGTGAWTGCMVASILKIPLSSAFFAIMLGNFLAGFIVLFLSHGTLKIIQ